MKEFVYTVQDQNGIHARPAGLIVQCAKGYHATLTMEVGGKRADCKKLFSLMQLGVKGGDEIILRADGTDEEEASAELMATLKRAGL